MLAQKYDISMPELDENGLLKDPQLWDETVALLIAQHNDIMALTEAHWRIVHALRDHYSKFKVPPAMSLLCRKQGFKTDCVHDLFCTCLTAWRVAGLPDPGEEAKSYLSAM